MHRGRIGNENELKCGGRDKNNKVDKKQSVEQMETYFFQRLYDKTCRKWPQDPKVRRVSSPSPNRKRAVYQLNVPLSRGYFMTQDIDFALVRFLCLCCVLFFCVFFGVL